MKQAYIIIIVVAATLSLNYGGAKASASDNISGWVWSETIGWISFNCTNTGSCGTSNYGVNAASSGNLSGYAWSESVGWLSFNLTGGCPQAPCQPKINQTTGEVSGWARFCGGTINGDCTGATRTDGWDGWVHFKGTASDGSTYGVYASGCGWDGWAWGSDVVAWIHFKGPTYGIVGSGNACRQISADIKANGSDGPITISYNTAATISWSSSGASSCSVSPAGWTGTSGSQPTGNLTSAETYDLICSGPGGQSSGDSVVVNVDTPPRPQIGSGGGGSGEGGFVATPSLLKTPGEISTLSWSSTNSTSCSIDQSIGSVPTTGSTVVSPARSTIYTLTCAGAGGEDSASVTVTVIRYPKFQEISP